MPFLLIIASFFLNYKFNNSNEIIVLKQYFSFHIEEEVSIFFNDQDNNKFIDVEALIYQDGQFITAKDAYIEIKNRNYNLIFNEGERVILNDIEKSKTTFDKFIYSIENKETEILMKDKEHFNTLQLLKNDNKEFYYHGHNRIYQYILTFSKELVWSLNL